MVAHHAERAVSDDYDSPWKEAVERYFADFLHFYFPVAHAAIDWSQPITFLEQELREVVRDAELGKRFVDKLVKVTAHNGRHDWLYIHLEVQGTAQQSFAERMFVYNYRLYDRYRMPVASLALLADDRLNWRPTSFGYEVLDCHMGIRFPVAKLLDWLGSEAKLADSSNPFAIITRAHLATRATVDDPDARWRAKWAIVKDLYRHNWDKQKVIEIFSVIDWMMWLPEQQGELFWEVVEVMEEETSMGYMTSIERLGMQKGIKQGMQQGKSMLLAQLMARRFGELPDWAAERLGSGSEAELQAWGEAMLTADTLTAVFSVGQP